MGRRSETGGVTVNGDRIQIRFTWNGKELRPTLDMKPTQAAMRHARRLREQVLDDIRHGEFDLRKTFPDYKFVDLHQEAAEVLTFADVRDLFLQWVRTRQEHASVVSLRRKLTSFWSPKFGGTDIRRISFKQLSAHVAEREWGSRKTHNNYVSALREMFAYALDHEYIEENPAVRLKMLKLQGTEPEPYTVQEARALIAAAHKAHGQVDGLYWELAFLLGMRPGEQISVQWGDWNRITNKLTVRRNRTEGESKDSTKTHRARHMDLTPRAIEVLQELRPVTSMRGPFIFIDYLTGEQIETSTVMSDRWTFLHKLAGVNQRCPYQCRHSSVSWKLMVGENPMKVAKNHGHSLATMQKTYAHWVESDGEAQELERIRAFHGFRTGFRTSTGLQEVSL